MIISGLNPFTYVAARYLPPPAPYNQLPNCMGDLVLDWWLTFAQAGLAPARTNTLCSAHSFKSPTILSRRLSTYPLIDVRGVFSSWDTWDTNSDLRRSTSM